MNLNQLVVDLIMCKIFFSGEKVAWVHLDRQMILTIHRQVVARIGRFSVSYDHQRTWHLHIRGVQQEDAGRYMCQVNSEPMISQVGHVHVVGAYT